MSKESIYSIPITSIFPAKQQEYGERKSVNKEELLAAMKQTGDGINTMKGVSELLPDVVMAKMILIASVLSPRDAQPASLDIRIDGKKLSKNINVSNLLAVLNKHFRTEHDLDSELEKIVGEVFFDNGSYINIYLPPTELDAQFSNMEKFGLEDIKDTFSGLEGRNAFLGGIGKDLSALKISGISDAIDILRRPALEKKTLLNVGLESLGVMTPSFNKEKEVKKDYLRINKPKDIDMRNPLVYKAPSDSVIPVIEPGRPDHHIGYFILLDERGNFLSNIRDSNQMEQLAARVKAAKKDNRSDEYIMVTSMGKRLEAKDKDNPMSLINAYIDEVESELKEAISKGPYRNTVEVTRPEAVYRIMFSRALSQQNTRILYLPKELVSYYAYEYDAMGVGESLLDRTRFIASLRAVLVVASMMGAVNNSISETVLEVELDDDETDPTGLLSTVRHEYAKLQNNRLPAGVYNVSDIISSLQNGAIRMSVSGGSKFPGTKLNVQDNQRSIATTDTDLSDQLKRLHMNGLWTIPELVDQALQGETATAIISSNNMMARRATTIQRWFKRMLVDDIKRYIYLSGELMDAINKELKGKEVEEFIEALDIYLPEVNTGAMEVQLEKYQQYSEIIDDIIQSYISEDMVADIAQGENVGEVLLSVQTAFAAYYKRKWLEEQGIVKDMHHLYTGSDEDKNIVDEISVHYDGILENVTAIVSKFIKKEDKMDKKVNKVRDKLDDPEEEGTDSEVTTTEEPEGETPDPEQGDGDDTGADDGDSDDLSF